MCYIFFTFILSSSSRLNLCSFSLNFIKNIISIFTIFFHIISVSVNCWSYICSISFSISCFCFLKVLDLFLQYSILIVFISNFMSSHLVLWFVAFILSSSKLSKNGLLSYSMTILLKSTYLISKILFRACFQEILHLKKSKMIS